MPYMYTPDELLDPQSLTPEELYALQSETWTQGYNYAINKAVNILQEDLDSLEKCNHDDCKKIVEIILKAIKNIKGDS